MFSLIKNIIIVIFIAILISCSAIHDIPDATKNYYMDLYITSDDYSGIGMLVLPKQPAYTIQIETDEKVDAIYFRTCSREIIKENPKRGVISKKYTIVYSPNEVELQGNCSATISTYNENGYYAVGFIDFESDDRTLPATNICENLTQKTTGVSVCQTRASSIERIVFENEVLAEYEAGCELPSKEGKEFTYQIGKGTCIYTFVERRSPNRIHRLTTYGYQDFLR